MFSLEMKIMFIMVTGYTIIPIIIIIQTTKLFCSNISYHILHKKKIWYFVSRWPWLTKCVVILNSTRFLISAPSETSTLPLDACIYCQKIIFFQRNDFFIKLYWHNIFQIETSDVICCKQQTKEIKTGRQVSVTECFLKWSMFFLEMKIIFIMATEYVFIFITIIILTFCAYMKISHFP